MKSRVNNTVSAIGPRPPRGFPRLSRTGLALVGALGMLSLSGCYYPYGYYPGAYYPSGYSPYYATVPAGATQQDVQVGAPDPSLQQSQQAQQQAAQQAQQAQNAQQNPPTYAVAAVPAPVYVAPAYPAYYPPPYPAYYGYPGWYGPSVSIGFGFGGYWGGRGGWGGHGHYH
ncbi:hypothetical protein PQQ51_08275 [Paraburkholderia xenovorans]|uniref:hypothetical protein n=1 Tax=Paraburkholderia xenovorans TaxID=36873 RepID=UPI0038B94DD7